MWPLVHDFAYALRARLNVDSPEVAILVPCYGLLAPTLVAAGCIVTPVSFEELFKRRGSKAPHAVVISQPSNPSGTYYSHDELLLLATYIVEQRLLLLSHEIFGLLNLNNPLATTVPSPVSLENFVSPWYRGKDGCLRGSC